MPWCFNLYCKFCPIIKCPLCNISGICLDFIILCNICNNIMCKSCTKWCDLCSYLEIKDYCNDCVKQYFKSCKKCEQKCCNNCDNLKQHQNGLYCQQCLEANDMESCQELQKKSLSWM